MPKICHLYKVIHLLSTVSEKDFRNKTCQPNYLLIVIVSLHKLIVVNHVTFLSVNLASGDISSCDSMSNKTFVWFLVPCMHFF